MFELQKKPFYLNEVQTQWVYKTFETMTTDEKLEQLFCPLVMTDEPDYLAYLGGRYQFGGFMFRQNKATKHLESLNILKQYEKIPFLLAANLEDGGSGIVEEGTYVGRQMLIGATGQTTHAQSMGRICGIEGKAMGVNWSFSPVIDIDLNFRNPITNVRTFGNNAEQVFSMGQAYVRGLESEGVVSTIKHFPGDGVDERDQHLVTSINTLSLSEWENCFGQVYRRMIDSGVRTLMVGHIAMPAIEAYLDQKPCEEVVPASISKNIMQGYLRDIMGYNGLITSDASPMVGFTSNTKRAEAVPLCIENGCDVFLFTRDLEEDIAYMKQGFEVGILSEKRLKEAVLRILALKASMGLHDNQSKEMSTFSFEQAEHHEKAKAIARDGITLVKDQSGLVPIQSTVHQRVLLQILGHFPSNERVFNQFKVRLEEEGFSVIPYVPETLATIFNNTSVSSFKDAYDLVIYIGNIENASNQTVARIQWHTLFGAGNNLPWFAKEVPTLFISVGNPYHLLDVPMIGTYINGYCNSTFVIDQIVDQLVGKSPFKGQSPIDPYCGLWDTKL